MKVFKNVFLIAAFVAVVPLLAGFVAVKAEPAAPNLNDLYGLSEAQVQNLLIVNDVVKDQDARQRLMGMMLQETLAGKLSLVGHTSQPVGQRAYGLMHVKLVALDDVLAANPTLWPGKHFDEVKIVRLMTDHAFNVKVAELFFELQRKRGLEENDALMAYNMGYDGFIKARDDLKKRQSKTYGQRVKDHAATPAVKALSS